MSTHKITASQPPVAVTDDSPLPKIGTPKPTGRRYDSVEALCKCEGLPPVEVSEADRELANEFYRRAQEPLGCPATVKEIIAKDLARDFAARLSAKEALCHDNAEDAAMSRMKLEEARLDAARLAEALADALSVFSAAEKTAGQHIITAERREAWSAALAAHERTK